MVDGRPSFNLVERAWLPGTSLAGRPAGDLGIRQVLHEAGRLREVGDPSPLTSAALYRFLLAVLHAALDGPATAAEWGALRAAGNFPADRIDAYLARWAERFDLFGPVHPFYQRADLEAEYAKPISQMVHELPTQDGATLFDHTTATSLRPLSGAEAARALVTIQAFAPGGLISLRTGENPKLFKSADASPLFKSAVVLVRGRTLFETLLLNLHRYAPDDDEPFATRHGDRPAWERDEPTAAVDRAPDGYRDLLTWQSRRVRLLPEPQADGTVGVRRVVLMKGNQFPDEWDIHGKETMVAYACRQDAKPGQQAWFPVGIRRERALWRDSTALFQSVDPGTTRPKTFAWLRDLHAAGIFDPVHAVFELDAFGIAADRQSFYAWRHERLPLPSLLLTEPRLVAALRIALALAEEIGRLLRMAAERFAELAVAPGTGTTGARKPDREKAVKPLARSLALDVAYWPRLETPFKHFVTTLPGDRATDEHGNDHVGARSLPDWGGIVVEVARGVMTTLAATSVDSARGLKAAAVAEGWFGRELLRALRDYLANVKGGV
jgi:CRISPR system Cascade subunit CasA